MRSWIVRFLLTITVICLFAGGCAAQQRRHGPGKKTVPPAELLITTTTLPAPMLNAIYSATLSASGGITPYTWSVSCGSLPTGLILSAAGIISGTPTAPGNYAFVLTVKDADPNPSPYPATIFNAPVPDCAALLAAPPVIANNLPPGVFRMVVPTSAKAEIVKK